MSKCYVLSSGYDRSYDTILAAYVSKSVANHMRIRCEEHARSRPVQWKVGEGPDGPTWEKSLAEWRASAPFPEHPNDDFYGITECELNTEVDQ